jgi:hypothetical protein
MKKFFILLVNYLLAVLGLGLISLDLLANEDVGDEQGNDPAPHENTDPAEMVAENPAEMDVADNSAHELPPPEESSVGAPVFEGLAKRIHEETYELIEAELFVNWEAFDGSLQKLFPLVQELIDLTEKHSAYPGVESIRETALAAAVHMDRIDYARYLKDEKRVSRLVGKLATLVKTLEKDIQKPEENPHDSDPEDLDLLQP